jgi:lipopolysaccharide/colanic/teichoic acid biosynthesis glycosyltransferase
MYTCLKRLMDLLVSLAATIILLPVFIIIAIAIKIDSPGPVFFKQTRIGKGGKPFICYKFRSMVHNADQSVYEEFLKDVMHGDADGPKGEGVSFQLKSGWVDPRITKVGRLLRKTSMDEFAQMINVFKGDMSWVGPRPDMPLSVAGYTDFERKRLDVLPGISGLWQISGRASLTLRQMFELDAKYVDECSLWLDIVILFKTIPAVIRRDGAA